MDYQRSSAPRAKKAKGPSRPGQQQNAGGRESQPQLRGAGVGGGAGSSCKVCAIVENRARETCIATMDTAHASVLQASAVGV